MEEFLKTKGIVLYSVDYKDYDKLVTIYLFNYGKITIKISSYKKSKKFKPAAIQMSFGEYTINVKKNNKLISHELIDAFMNSNNDIKKYYAKSSVVEVFTKIVKEKIKKDELAILLLSFLKSIEYSEDSEEKYVAYTLLKFLDFEGYISDFELDYISNELFNKGAEFEFNEKGLKAVDNFSNYEDTITNRGLKQLQYLHKMTNIKNLEEIKSCKVEKNIIKWLFRFIEYKFEINLNAYKEYIKF